METDRLLIRPMADEDETPFITGISDRSLRISYGFPPDMDSTVPPRIFHRFRGLKNAYSLLEKQTGTMIGFLLDVEPELPEEIRLPGKGRTLAFAVFPPFRRRGCMREALEAYISSLFRETDAEYIHCGHFPDNEACRSLLIRLGFHDHAVHTSEGRTVTDKILIR